VTAEPRNTDTAESDRGRRARRTVLASLTLIVVPAAPRRHAVALALPAIRRQLRLGLPGLEWVVNG